jgi:hypothetical protein
MADTDHLPHVSDSAEHVAYRLLEMIIAKDPPKPPLPGMNATWILTTYARCLRTVRNPEPPAKPEAPKPPSLP